MLKIPVIAEIANTAACLLGPDGDVTARAQPAGCRRQTADFATPILDRIQTLAREGR